jgi:hypothetical protein
VSIQAATPNTCCPNLVSPPVLHATLTKLDSGETRLITLTYGITLLQPGWTGTNNHESLTLRCYIDDGPCWRFLLSIVCPPGPFGFGQPYDVLPVSVSCQPFALQYRAIAYPGAGGICFGVGDTLLIEITT